VSTARRKARGESGKAKRLLRVTLTFVNPRRRVDRCKTKGSNPRVPDDAGKKNYEGASDEELLDLSLRGVGEAQTILFRRWALKLHRFVRPLLMDMGHFSADDAVQETFLLVFTKGYQFRKQSQVFTWVCGIAWRLCKSAMRRQLRRQGIVRFVPMPEERDGLDAVAQGPDLETWTSENRRWVRLMEGVAHLKSEDWVRALFLQKVFGFTVEEIAHYLGIAPAAVRLLLTDAETRFLALPAVQSLIERDDD
jgi:DNA-directed RNA polymerase specialized sigma24 family protein